MREYFTPQTCSFLFKQYNASFYTDSGNFLISGEDSNNLKLFEIDQDDETALIGNLSLENILFNDTSITFADFGSYNIFSFSIFKKEK